MAISEARKKELVAEYTKWLNQSRAVILAEYVGLSMKDLDALRGRIRDIGGEFHVVKNTLGEIAFRDAGMPVVHGFFAGSTAAAFAFKDAHALAKTITEFARTAEFLKLKGGYLDGRPMSAEQVQALADLPPLPVMRARVLGAIVAPASQLARFLAEPGRRLAAVIKAHSEAEVAPAAAG